MSALLMKIFKEPRDKALQEINRVQEDFAYYAEVKKIADEAANRCNFGKVSFPLVWSTHFANF